MESHPELRQCLVACARCGIHFLTHPRCAGRIDLRCPFGCRQTHHQQRSNQRSAAYYGTPSGKAKKERLNRRRYRQHPSADVPPPPEPSSPMIAVPPADAGEKDEPPLDECPQVPARFDGVFLDESSVTNSPLLPYVRMLVSLIVGVRPTCRELVELLLRIQRQHRFASRSKIDYVLHFPHEHPP